MRKLLAIVSLLALSGVSRAQMPAFTVIEESWDVKVNYAGSDGRTVILKQNLGITKIILTSSGALVQQWGATPVTGGPATGFRSNDGRTEIAWTGTIAGASMRDIR